MALDDTPCDAGAPAQRRPELPPHPSPGPLRPSFRRHHRRRPADRPGARGAVRLRAGPHLARLRRLPGRGGPRLHHPLGLDPPRRALAGRDRPRQRSARWRASPPPSPSSSSSSSPWPASASPSSTRCTRAPGARSRSACRSRSRCSWASTCTGSARAGSPRRPSIGVIGLLLAVILGKPVAASAIGPYFSCRASSSSWRWRAYGFIASVLPVWLLLCPRDYLSSFMKIGTIAFLVVGVMIVNPTLQMPAAHAVHRRRRTDHSRARSSRSSSSRSPAARSPASTR